MDKYLNFCKKCIEGKVGYSPKFYELNPKNSETDRVTDKPVEVTPTETAVEQAKSEIKLKKAINSMAGTHKGQSGGKTRKCKITKKSSRKIYSKNKNKILKGRSTRRAPSAGQKGGKVKTKKKKLICTHYGCNSNSFNHLPATSHR